MQRRSVVCLALAFATSLASAQGPDIAHDFVLTATDAVGLLSPRVVSGALTTKLLWSPDGSLLLARRTVVQPSEEAIIAMMKGAPAAIGTTKPPKPGEELVFYSPRADKIRSIVPLGDPSNQISDLEWIPGSQQVLIQYTRVVPSTEKQPAGYLVNTSLLSSDGRITQLSEINPETDNVQVSVSPVKPILVLLRQTFPPSQPGGPRSISISVYSTSGKELANQENKLDGFPEPEWAPDGSLCLIVRKVDREKHSVLTSFHKVDLATAKLGPEIADPGRYRPTPPKQVVQTLALENSGLSKDSTQPTSAVLLIPSGKSETRQSAIVSADSAEGLISPNGESVAYISRGVAMVRPLVHIPKEAFLQAQAAAKRALLINQAKQVGLGFLLYAGDNDDVLPAAGTDLMSKLGPYLKNNDMLNGFVYSFRGGDLTSVEAPATTELGYIPGPGGTAVVYIDGHVKWRSDKP